MPQVAKVAVYKQVPIGRHRGHKSMKFVGDINPHDTEKRKRVLEGAAKGLGVTLSTNLNDDGNTRIRLITDVDDRMLHRPGFEIGGYCVERMEVSEILVVREELARNGITVET
jgi:hypothetical protein